LTFDSHERRQLSFDDDPTKASAVYDGDMLHVLSAGAAHNFMATIKYEFIQICGIKPRKFQQLAGDVQFIRITAFVA